MQSTPLNSQVAPGQVSQAASTGLPAVAARGVASAGGSKAFQQVLADVRPAANAITVESGDTLIGLVKAHYRQNGEALSESRAYHLAHQVAGENQIHNPNLIIPGQTINFSALNLPALVRMPQKTPQVIGSEKPFPTAADMLAQRHSSTASRAPQAANDRPNALFDPHPVLDRTLQRAADKGFVSLAQLPEVKQKIVALSQRYNFAPDDFARLSLMESGGLNPQASNGSCHGIIQFCDGENRGAAAVGLKNNPRSILGMGLLQQLDLVDKYFSQAGLSTKGPRLGLDDLYLTVLTPAARQETRPNAPLPIAGPQAKSLHVGGDTRAPITRNSILSGLHALTNALLEPGPAKSAGSRWYANVAKSPSNPLR